MKDLLLWDTPIPGIVRIFYFTQGDSRENKPLPLEISRNCVTPFGNFNPIQDGPFWGCSRIGGGREAKICHTYPTMMKLGRVIP